MAEWDCVRGSDARRSKSLSPSLPVVSSFRRVRDLHDYTRLSTFNTASATSSEPADGRDPVLRVLFRFSTPNKSERARTSDAHDTILLPAVRLTSLFFYLWVSQRRTTAD